MIHRSPSAHYLWYQNPSPLYDNIVPLAPLTSDAQSPILLIPRSPSPSQSLATVDCKYVADRLVLHIVDGVHNRWNVRLFADGLGGSRTGWLVERAGHSATRRANESAKARVGDHSRAADACRGRQSPRWWLVACLKCHRERMRSIVRVEWSDRQTVYTIAVVLQTCWVLLCTWSDDRLELSLIDFFIIVHYTRSANCI